MRGDGINGLHASYAIEEEIARVEKHKRERAVSPPPEPEPPARIQRAIKAANIAYNQAAMEHNKKSRRRAKNRVATKSRRQNRSK